MRKVVLSLLVALSFALTATAQDRVITGTVTNGNNNPEEGISVSTPNGKFGTKTNGAGYYSLKLPSTEKTLIFSGVNFETMTVTIGNSSLINSKLVSTNSKMDEVVVVAYGTQKKEAITGSQSEVNLEDRPGVGNLTQALAGAAPGISATSGNGQPGSNAAIRIRGFGSINASSAPLYVVDGFPYGGFISDINVNDIETLTLLKDASSTALYGARAANGVILITTKKGKSSIPKINLYGSSGLSSRGIPEYDKVGTNDYYPVMWQGLKNSLQYPVSGVGQSAAVAAQNASNTIATQLVYNPYNVPNNQIVGTDGKLNPNATLLYNDFDWFKDIERQGPRNEGGFSIASKNNKSDYYFSLNYLNDKGFVIRSDFERYNARLSINTQVRDWLKTGINVTSAIVDAKQAAGDGSNTFINPFVFARGIGPIYPVRAFSNTTGAPILDPQGVQYYDYGQYPGSINRPAGASPGRHILYESLLNESINSRNSTVARSYVEAKFLKYFSLTANFGIDLNNSKAQTYQNRIVGDGVTGGGTSSRTSNEFRTVSLNQLLNYKQKFGVHEVSVLLGHETQKNDDTYVNVSKRGQVLDNNIELENFVTLTGSRGELQKLRREGYLSRITYGYDSKYFLDLSGRQDVSSRFAPGSYTGYFGSVGVSWSAKRESFLENVDWINALKFRASYGTVGNDELASYYQYQGFYTLGFNNATEPGILSSTLANPDLTWEVNKTSNIGVDFGFLKNRITGSLEYFHRGSDRLLFSVAQGLSSIITNQTQNIGAMYNKGVELNLGLDVVRTEGFNWDLQFNFTALKNEITELPPLTPVIINGTKRLERGHDIYAFYLRRWAGVDPTDGAGLYYAAPGTAASNIRVNGKGDSLTTNPTFAAYGYSGSAIPKHFGSLTNNFSYKNISLSFLMNYQVGGKFYDGTYAGLMGFRYGSSLHADALKAWKNPGDITDVPRLDANQTGNFNAASDRWLIDASYINVRNVTLSFRLPKTFTTKVGFDQAKVFVGAENLYVFSKRRGLNPAESFNGTNSPVYTPNRLINAGFNITF